MRDSGWHVKVANYVSVNYEQDQWLASFKNRQGTNFIVCLTKYEYLLQLM